VAAHQYLTAGTQILDANLHVQQVATPGTSGTYASTPFHPAWSTSGGTVVDNAVTWTDHGISPCAVCGSWVANHAYAVGNQIVDSAHHLQVVTTAGTSGPSVPTFNHSGSTTIDGLTWTDLGTSVVARYPVSGTTTLQALTLDPFVTDCTGSAGTACASSYTSAPTIKKFWMADHGSSSFYSLDFLNGTPTGYSANDPSCSDCVNVTSVQGIGIYGGEGANQPGLASLLPSTSIGTVPSSSSKTVQFLKNSETVSLYNLTAPVNMALYASLVDSTSCFNDENAARPCRRTTSDSTKAIVWKIDVPQDTASLVGFTNASIATKYSTPVGATPTESIDNGTDAFTDMLYDTTVLVGNFDPGQFTKPSVQSLHEVPFTANGGAACTFSSPVANTCYKTNRGTLPFTIPQCSGMSIADFSTLGLDTLHGGGLSLVQTFGSSQAPLPVNLSGTTNNGATNRKASFRYDSTKNQWVYQLNMSSLNGATGTFNGCAFDGTHKAQTFCIGAFTVSNSCK
jgi:hypothetical protein